MRRLRLAHDTADLMFSTARKWLPSGIGGAVITCLVVLGVALRLRQYLFNRSLWLDEAFLAINVVDQNLISLLSVPLKYSQSAPPGFLLASRSFVVLLGREEWVLRLAPLIAGLLLLMVAVVLARHEFKSTAGRVAFVGLVALSPVLVYYSSEFKQYSLEALVASGILLAVSYRNSKYGTWLLAVAGFVGILCSLPAVFVAAAAGVLLVYEAYRSSQWRQTISVGLAWSAAVALYAGHFLWVGTNRDVLIGWWTRAGNSFAPFPPSSVHEWLWYPRSLSGLTYLAFRNSGRAIPKAEPPPYLFDALSWSLSLALVIAVAAVVLTGRRTALVAVGAILTTYIASALVIYPFSSRLLIFCVPLTFFILATGINELSSRGGSFTAAFACGLLLSVMIPSAVEVAQRPYFSSDMRGALVRLNRGFKDGDAIALWKSDKLFTYYKKVMRLPHAPIVDLNARKWEGRTLTEIAERTGYRRIWVVTAHRSGQLEPLIRQTAQTVPIVYEWTTQGTRLVLFDFTRN